MVVIKITTHKNPADILPPFKKHRDELSILKALSSCVREDPTGYNYRIIDDPNMLNRYMSRTYLSSKAAGIHAARYMLHLMPNIFAGLRSEEPKIHRFSPILSAQYLIDEFEGKKATADQTLNSLIMLAASKEAWKFYSELDQEVAAKLPDSLVQSLLELLAASNGENIELETNSLRAFVEECDTTKKPTTTWDRDGPAETLFRRLTKKRKASYCALIRGCAKYYDLERVLALESEMRQSNFSPDLCTYNGILRCIFLIENESSPYDKIHEYLTQMKKEGIRPNLSTFVNITYSLRQGNHFSIGYATSLLKEVNKLDIEPSLGLYANIISRAPFYFIENLFDQLNQKDFLSQEIHSTDDFYFFYIAMSIALNSNNVVLAHKIHKYLVNTSRLRFLGQNHICFVYYVRYMQAQYHNDPLDSVMKNIWKYPQACNSKDINFLINRIRKDGSYHFLSNIWEYIIAQGRFMGENNCESPLVTILNVVRSIGAEKVDFMPSLNRLEQHLKMNPVETNLLTTCTKDSVHSKCIRHCLQVNNVDAAIRWCQVSDENELEIPFSILISLCESCESLDKIDSTFYVLQLIKDRINEGKDLTKARQLVNKLSQRDSLNDSNRALLEDVTKYLDLKASEQKN